MVYRFLKTLKQTEVKPEAEAHQVIQYPSAAAVCLFMRHPDKLDEGEQMDLETAYHLTQDFLQSCASARKNGWTPGSPVPRKAAFQSCKALRVEWNKTKPLCKQD
jgi:hypothetical protein